MCFLNLLIYKSDIYKSGVYCKTNNYLHPKGGQAVLKLNKCSSCYDGVLLDEDHYDYENIDRQIDKLFDGGHFSYYDAFVKVTGKVHGVKKCLVCNGTGKSE